MDRRNGSWFPTALPRRPLLHAQRHEVFLEQNGFTMTVLTVVSDQATDHGPNGLERCI